MKRKGQRLSQAFQRRLLVLVIVAFLITTVFLWLFQTRLAEENAVRLLELNISDVQQDIMDASDENLLNITWQVAAELNQVDTITNELLLELTEQQQDRLWRFVNLSNEVDERLLELACEYMVL